MQSVTSSSLPESATIPSRSIGVMNAASTVSSSSWRSSSLACSISCICSMLASSPSGSYSRMTCSSMRAARQLFSAAAAKFSK